MVKTTDFTDSDPSAFSGWHNGKGLHALRKLIWELADPNMESYDPWRALQLLRDTTKEKWMAEQYARTEMGIERGDYSELENLQHAPIIDNGSDGIEQQVRTAVNQGLRYLNSPSLGTEPEYPHVLARKRLGFSHSINDDTPEQSEALYREELRVVHETCLAGAIYDLGEARDAQHLAYLQSHVDKHTRFLEKLDNGEIKSGFFDKHAPNTSHEDNSPTSP